MIMKMKPVIIVGSLNHIIMIPENKFKKIVFTLIKVNLFLITIFKIFFLD